MNKKIFSVLIPCFLVILVTFSSAYGQEKKILIRYTHQHPTMFSFHKGAERFTKLVEQKSNGRVKFELYPASQLYKGSETVKAVTSGAVEMGHCVVDEWGLIFPLADIFMQPFLVTSKEVRREITRGKVGESLEKEMIRVGARPLFWMPHDFLSVFLNNKRPLKVPKDFEGLLIRTTPGTLAMVEALGAKAVRMNVDEVYMGLQRGTIDGTWTAPSSGTNRKWQEVSKYSTIIDIVTVYNVAFVNTNFWNKLPADIQKVMNEASDEAEKWVEEIAVKEQDEAVQILKEKTQAYFPTPQEVSLWESATQRVVENFVKKGGPTEKSAVDEVYRMKTKMKK